MGAEEAVTCPQCGASAYNRYGKAPNGRQRYICLVCGRQFVNKDRHTAGDQHPSCPACGGRMHVYMRSARTIRYRCALYPKCKTFVKRNTEEKTTPP